MDLAYDAIFVLRLPDNVITYWNRGAEDLYGWRASEAIGKNSVDLLHTLHDRPRDEIVAEVIRSGRWSGSILQTRRDGAQMMVDARWALETDDEGRPRSILEINRDVTKLRTMLSQLEFANQISAQLNSSLEPRVVLDRLLTIAVAAAQATHATVARIEGIEGIVEASQDARGQGIPEGLRWRLTAPAVLEAVRSRKPGASGPDELRYLSDNLKPYLEDLPYRLVIPLAMADDVIGVILIGRREAVFSREQREAVERMATPAALALHNSRLFQDAVHQKEAAQRNERRLRMALEVGQEMASEPELETLLHNLLARAISMTEAEGAFIGKLDGEDLIVEDVVHAGGDSSLLPGAHVEVTSMMQKAFRTGKPVQGGTRDLEEMFHPLGGSDSGCPRSVVVLPLSVAGDPIGLLGLLRWAPDQFAEQQIQAVHQLTAVAALLLRMGRLLQDARQGEAAKSEFLNMAGHELRTPLTVLKGYISLLDDGSLAAPPEAWNRPLSMIKAQLASLEQLIESLVTASRTVADELKPSLQRVDLNIEVRAAVLRAEPRIELEGADVSYEPSSKPVEALADPEHLDKILDNLIRNALDYSPSPAHLSLKVEAGAEPAILVRDSGIGIPPEARARVFERFVRLAPSVMPTKSGSGLGLFIARSLARNMGGDVSIVDSEPGRGTTMVVKLLAPRTDG